MSCSRRGRGAARGFVAAVLVGAVSGFAPVARRLGGGGALELGPRGPLAGVAVPPPPRPSRSWALRRGESPSPSEGQLVRCPTTDQLISRVLAKKKKVKKKNKKNNNNNNKTGTPSAVVESPVDEDDRRATYALIAAAVAVTVAVFATVDGDLPTFDLDAALTQLSENVDAMGSMGLAYFAAVYVACEIFALPAVPLTASAGYLFGAAEGTAVVLVSATIAAGISFTVGRTLLRPWVERIAAESPQFAAIDAAVAREGFKIVLLLRLSPIFPFALSNYFYGLTAVEFGPYLLATLLGFSPGTFLFVYGGDFASVLRDGDETLPWYAYAAVLALGSAFAAYVTSVATAALEEAGGILPPPDDE